MALLIVEKGQDKGKAVPLAPGCTVLIGRDSSTALQLRDNMSSRMHFKVESREDGFWIDDLGSMNGTYVNGDKIREPHKLEPGDLIKVGETLFTFQSEDASATTLSGQRIGGYRIVERLGRGGMGTVYKAEQVDLQRMVALKVISEEHTKDMDFIELFIHEARAAAKLNHPNVVQVYDVKRHTDTYYFSMEYVSGGSVQDILNRQKRVPVDQTVQMILDAAKGLDYAHKKGIVHRDVKPDNLMISETGMVKIGDMGLARGLEEKVGPEEETSVIGTPHYIAPEQVLGRPADFRCDIYSLGATMYRMLAGVTPFVAPSVRDLVNKKVREDAPSVCELNPDVSRPLGAILSRMMARDPDRRYQKMEEVVQALEKYQRGQAEALSETRREGSTTIQTLVRNKKLLAGAVTMSLVILMGIVFGLFSLFKEPARGPERRPRVADPERASQALWVVKASEVRMDRSDARSIEKVMDDYSRVIEEFPGTPAARTAAEARATLQKQLREVQAVAEFQLVEASETASYKKFAQSFGAKKVDLGPVDEAIAAYQKFAQAEKWKDTLAARQATARAEHIRMWKSLLEQTKVEYDRAIRKSQWAKDQQKYREALAALRSFEHEVKKQEPPCEFSRDRYSDLFFDEAVVQDQQSVTVEAKANWEKVKLEATALARDRNFEAAIKMLEDVIQNSVDEVAEAAGPLKKAWEEDWAMETRRVREAEEAASREALEKARAAFAQESILAHKLFEKDYDFKGALQRIKFLRDTNTAEELRSRLERRVMEMERVARFKEGLLAAVRSKDPKVGFKREYSYKGVEGMIDDADDKSIKVTLPDGGGTIQLAWSQYDGAGFYKFVKDQWKGMDLGERCDLAAVCMEFGLYEEALKEINDILEALKNPQTPAPDTVRDFCEEYRVRIQTGDSATFEETEAKKRLDRLVELMKDPKRYGAARTEIDLLRSRYGRTKAVGDQQAVLDGYAQTLRKQGGDLLNKARSEELLRMLSTRVADEQAVARKAQPDIVARLSRIDDAFLRNAHLGSVYAAAGDWKASRERYGEAKTAGDSTLKSGQAGKEFLPSLASVYSELFRDEIVLKDKKNAEAIKNEGSRRFVNPMTKMEEPFWTELIVPLGKWSEEIYPAEEKKLPRLRDEVRANPEDPQKLWALALSLVDGAVSFTEARGYLVYLLENHPQFAQVQNGNCLYRLAELLYAARDVREAIKRYQELRDQNKDHPRVADLSGPSGVRRRLDDCYKLFNRMGYPREKGK
jgi:serine/threonine-protein kinase